MDKAHYALGSGGVPLTKAIITSAVKVHSNKPVGGTALRPAGKARSAPAPRAVAPPPPKPVAKPIPDEVPLAPPKPVEAPRLEHKEKAIIVDTKKALGEPEPKRSRTPEGYIRKDDRFIFDRSKVEEGTEVHFEELSVDDLEMMADYRRENDTYDGHFIRDPIEGEEYRRFLDDPYVVKSQQYVPHQSITALVDELNRVFSGKLGPIKRATTLAGHNVYDLNVEMSKWALKNPGIPEKTQALIKHIAPGEWLLKTDISADGEFGSFILHEMKTGAEFRAEEAGKKRAEDAKKAEEAGRWKVGIKGEEGNAKKAKLIKDAIIPGLQAERKDIYYTKNDVPFLDYEFRATTDMVVPDNFRWEHEEAGLFVAIMFLTEWRKVSEYGKGRYLVRHFRVVTYKMDEYDGEEDIGEQLEYAIKSISEADFGAEFLDKITLI